MKFPVTVLMLCMATLAQSKETPGVPAGVPADAVAIESHTWRSVDKSGKAWLFRATPFGVMRSEEPKLADAKRPAGVPAKAEPVSDGVWRFTDAERKVWLFQETPSGIMKTEEVKGSAAAVGPTGLPVADARPDATLDLITVRDEGENLHFSRPGPFGKYSWVKKKTQLDRDETIVWERAKANRASAKKD